METLMQLYLSTFKENEVLGIYGPGKDTLPARMCYLHPKAASSFSVMNEEHPVKCSDMFRTPAGSLLNRQQENGKGLRPGWSGHNYGFSIDIDVTWMMKKMKLTKVGLDSWMESHGWHCHNIPRSKRAHESWHYNYFGDEAELYLSFRDSKPSSWDEPVAAKINDYYSHWWENLDAKGVQTALKATKFYKGPVDGNVIGATKAAIRAFQLEWGLAEDGVAGPMTKRTLMVVSAEKVVVTKPC